jgi:hypothetical protein
MKLPQELLDEIFSYLSSYDGRSLKACSLVSKSWLESSQRLLFADIFIDVDNCQSWLNTILPTNARLLRRVRSLTCFVCSHSPPNLRYRVLALREYLPSFCQLRTLIFLGIDIEPTILEHLDLFSAFQHTLSSLSIREGSITWSAFVSLVGYFPNLRDLKILLMSFEVDSRPAPRPIGPLRGRLSVELREGESTDLFADWFPALRLEYEELEISQDFGHRFLTTIAHSLKYLKLTRIIRMLPFCA